MKVQFDPYFYDDFLLAQNVILLKILMYADGT